MNTDFVTSAKLPTRWGDFTIYGFSGTTENKDHVALVMGSLETEDPVLCRVHSECLTGDALFSLRCDCGSQLAKAMEMISEKGAGIILYLRQEGRNIGLNNKIKAYHLQDQGADTVEANMALGFEADERRYDICQPMLEHFGIKKLQLMTNNPRKVKAMEDMGFEVSRVPLATSETPHNEAYLATKRSKLGHIAE